MSNRVFNRSHSKTLPTLMILISLFIGLCSSSMGYAAKLNANPEVKKFIARTAQKYKYSPNYIRHILNRARYNSEVIRRMERPYEALPWSHYQKLFLTDERVAGGLKYWNRSNKLLAWEEREYQVPSSIILAIIGIETKYGKDMGHFRVLDALTTLAFYYPSRQKFFQQQLAAFIVFAHIHRIPPSSVYGSYAGAMGQAQFMPSSMLHYSVDFHGRDNPNLFQDKADVIFSIGNYLRQNGWEPEQPIAVRARIVGQDYQRILKQDNRKIKKPKLSLATLARYNVYPAYGHYQPHLKANLIKLQGAQGPEYWIAFHNFYVITTYNNSDLYAMAAFQLANKIKIAYEQKKQQANNKTNAE